jgi:hypothetical protein
MLQLQLLLLDLALSRSFASLSRSFSRYFFPFLLRGIQIFFRLSIRKPLFSSITFLFFIAGCSSSCRYVSLEHAQYSHAHLLPF